MSVEKKVALVTGVSKGGSGMASALALVQAGWLTYAGARHVENVAQLREQGIRVIPLDVTDEQSMQSAVQQIEVEQGAVDALVNNAAYGEMGPVEEVSIERIRRQFETNVFGLVRMCQLVLPGMRRKGWGRIVNVSSMGGEFTTPFAGFYHATKYAVESLSDALRIEVEPFGIDVVVVQPGGINTPLGHQTIEAIPDGVGSAYAEALRGFRQVSDIAIQATDMMVTPQQVAHVILEAIQAEKPLTRSKVNANDMTQINQERNTVDRQRDATFRQQFNLPSIQR